MINIKNYLIIYKNKGKFYNAYDVDAYILNDLFGYKVLDGKKAGFPDNAFNKIENKINDLKISFQIIENGKDPVVKDYKKTNTYQKYYNKALDNMNIDSKLKILEKEIYNLPSDKLDKLIEVINEFTHE